MGRDPRNNRRRPEPNDAARRSRSASERPRRPQDHPVRRRKSKAARRRARQRRRMLLLLVLVAIVVVVVVLIVRAVLGSAVAAPEKTLLSLNADGRIVYDEVSELPEEYDAKKIQQFAKEQVEAFDPSGEKSVELKYFKADGNKALVRMEYESADVYSSFTGYDTFNGSVSEALRRGYNFEGSFINPNTGSRFTRDEVLEDENLKVFIVQENTTVAVDGELVFVSEEGTNVSDGEVTIASLDGNPDAAPLCYIIYKSKEN